ERGHHGAVGPQRLLDQPSGTERALAHFERCLRVLLAADAGEELVQVVHHADWLFHAFLPRSRAEESIPSRRPATSTGPTRHVDWPRAVGTVIGRNPCQN